MTTLIARAERDACSVPTPIVLDAKGSRELPAPPVSARGREFLSRLNEILASMLTDLDATDSFPGLDAKRAR